MKASGTRFEISKMHWEYTTSEQIKTYQRKPLTLTAQLFDRFGNEAHIPRSYKPSLVHQTGPQDGLQCTRTSTTGSIVNIEYCFLKKGEYVISFQFQDHDGRNKDKSFSITVKAPPVNLQRSKPIWVPEYEDIPEQPVFVDDGFFQCQVNLIDVFGNPYEGDIEITDLTVKCGDTELNKIIILGSVNQACLDVIVSLKGISIQDGDFEPKFWFFFKGKKITQPLVLPTFVNFQEFDSEVCTVLESKGILICRNTRKADIIGPDSSHLDNIKRVCELEKDLNVMEESQEHGGVAVISDHNDGRGGGAGAGGSRDDDDDNGGDHDDDGKNDGDDDDDDGDDDYDDDDYDDDVDNDENVKNGDDKMTNKIVITLQKEDITKINKCHDVLLNLLKALHLRQKAFEVDGKRRYWKKKAGENYQRIRRDKNLGGCPTFCRKIKEKYGILMKMYHKNACDEFFRFFNTERSQSEIDLHGLLVADERKLKDYERQLRCRENLPDAQISEKIEDERRHGDEAIRKLEERLEICETTEAGEDQEPWLEIIVGSGHHSRIPERQKIRPKVEEYLKQREIEYSPVNKGALVVTFQKYRGREPCFGEYYCQRCNHSWRNNRSWVDKWQGCYRCYTKKGMVVECFPSKQRLKSKKPGHRPAGTTGGPNIGHLEELCQKCKEVGHKCSNFT